MKLTNFINCISLRLSLTLFSSNPFKEAKSDWLDLKWSIKLQSTINSKFDLNLAIWLS